MTQEKDLVSIITPCLNGEHYVQRFLDSILKQTYSNIELIFVNDGSTDDTEKIVLSYQAKFEENGIKLIYIYQTNKGLGGAINTGLQKVSGKYLCWPDSDDYLEPDSVKKRVEVFEKYPHLGVVTSNAFVRSIDDLTTVINYVGNKTKHRFEENQFEHLLKGESQFCSGTHMIKMSCLKEVNPNLTISPYRRGQNWQMLLPVYYKYKRHYLDLPLYNYIIYKTSMSQGDTTLEKKLFRSEEHEEIITETLHSMLIPQTEKDKYIFETRMRYAKRKLNIAFEFRDIKLFKEQFSILKQNSQLSMKERMLSVFIQNNIFYKIIETAKFRK